MGLTVRKPSVDRATKLLNFDNSLLEITYPKGTHSITFGSRLRTALMKDADHNARKVGAVVRAVLELYYFKGGFSSGRGNVGRGRVDSAADIKKAVRGISKEEKKRIRDKQALNNELASVLSRFKERAETVVGDDDHRLRAIEEERANATERMEKQKTGIVMERKE